MSSLIQFGEDVPGYDIRVLNEREIRAAAGILFVLMLVAILTVILKNDFLLLKYAVTFFLTDMLIRVLVNPKLAPTLIVGRWIVRNQTPEYVGAQQKKFAWIIGLVLGTIMFALQVVVNSYSPITGLICLICLIFLFFETSFGICIGCKFYGLISKDKAQYCPGEVCEPNARHDIQRTTPAHFLIVFGFAAYIVLIVFLFNDEFRKEPYDLLGLDPSAHVEQ